MDGTSLFSMSQACWTPPRLESPQSLCKGTFMATNGKLEVTRLREEVGRMTTGTEELIRITEQVLSGTKNQLRSLDDSASAAAETAASLKETGSQATTVAAAANQLASSA